MPQIPVPKLPCAKLGIVNSKSGTYYYVQTYTHHYDKEKKRSVRDSQKTIGTVTGGDKYGVIKFKQFFLDEHPELENFIVSWTKDGFSFKLADEEEFSTITEKTVEKKHAGASWTKDGFSFKLADEEEFSTIIEKPVEKKHAGASWALQKLMGESGIGDALKETFSSYKRHLKLASLAIYMVIKRTNAMHYYEPFSKITWLPWSKTLNDGQITRLFQSITYDEVMRFFNALNRNYLKKFGKDFHKRVFVALDSTSVSTYSNKLSMAEYGHNKDGDDIPQINYMLVCDEVTGLPIYAKVYKGNVVDVTTVKNLLSELKIMHSRVSSDKYKNDEFSPSLIFVTDRGYDSEDNLQNFLMHDYSFVIRSTLRSKWVQEVILENYDNLMDDNSLDTYTSQHMYSVQVEYKYDDFPVDKKYKSNKATANIHVHMYFDESIKSNSRASIKANTAVSRDEYNKLVDKLYGENKTVTPELLSQLKLQDASKQKFIDRYCVFDDKGYAKISADKIDEKLKFTGIKVLLSDVISDAKEAYFAYEKRNTVENNFQIFKDHLNFDRIHSSSDRGFQGKFLCQLIASSLKMLLNTRIRDYEKSSAASKDGIKFSNKSLSRIIEDLDTLMLSVYKGGYYFDEICGIYKTIYKAIDIPLPEAKHKYEPDQDDKITDEELNAEYEQIDDDLVEIEKSV